MPFYNIQPDDKLYTDDYVILVRGHGGGWVRWYKPYDEDGTYFFDEALEIVKNESHPGRPMKIARVLLDVIT